MLPRGNLPWSDGLAFNPGGGQHSVLCHAMYITDAASD